MALLNSIRKWFSNRRTPIVNKRQVRLELERLEDRLAPATFTDAAPTLTLTLANSDQVGIVANATTYTLALTSGTWMGTNDANVTGNGTATLTVQKAAFTQVNLTDTGAGTSAAFNDSGANAYTAGFSVQLGNASAGAIAFNGASSFGAFNLVATTTRNLSVNSGAAISASAGTLTLKANTAGNTAGNFSGINVNNATIQTTGAGTILLQGDGGNDGATSGHIGVLINNGAHVTATSTGSVSITGTGGTGTDSDYGANITGAGTKISAAVGGVSITGTGGSGASPTFNQIGVFINGGAQVSATGVGTITIKGTGGPNGVGPTSNFPVDISDSGTNVTSASGAIAITGILGAGPATSALNVLNSAQVTAANAPITLTGDGWHFDATTAAISAVGHRVLLQQLTDGQVIGLNADVNVITADTLQVGNSKSGDIHVAGSPSSPNVTTLDLETAGSVIDPVVGHIVVPNLAIRCVNAVTMDQGHHDVSGALAVNISGAGQGIAFRQVNDLTIGTADGLSGITTNGGAIEVISDTGNLTVNQNVSAGSATITLGANGGPVNAAETFFTNNAAISNSGGNTIFIFANRMALGAAPTSTITAAGGGRVILDEALPGRPINLGPTADPTGSLNLSDAELKTVTTTGVLQIGFGFEGDITISSAITLANVNTLDLQTGGGIGENSGGTVTVANLAIRAKNAVAMTNANDVTTGDLAAIVSSDHQSFAFTDTNDLTIGTADGLSGITTTQNGAVTVNTTNGNLTVNQNISTGGTAGNMCGSIIDPCTGTGGPVTLSAGGIDSLFTNSAAISRATSGIPGIDQINIQADRMALGAAGTSSITGIGSRVELKATSAGRPINLGPTSDPTGSLNLSDAELNTVQQGTNALFIGGGTESDITISAAIHVINIDLHLRAAGGINETTGSSTGTITADHLVLAADNAVNLPNANSVYSLGGFVANANQAFSFNNAGGLVVSATTNGGAITVTTTDGGLDVASVSGGDVNLTASGTATHQDNILRIVSPVNSRGFIGGTTVTLTADRMSLEYVSAIFAPIVTLKPFAPGRTIDLGGTGDPTGALTISQAELNLINLFNGIPDTIVRIGSSNAGNLTVTAAVAPSYISTLTLISGGNITESGPGAITVPNLDVQAAGGAVFLSGQNHVSGNLAASASGQFFFNQGNTFAVNDLTIGTADTQSGISLPGGVLEIFLQGFNAQLTVNQPINNPNTGVTMLLADRMALNAAVNVGTSELDIFPPSNPVTLGSKVAGTLGLTDAELDRITAGTLSIEERSGGITVTNPIDAENHYRTLGLGTPFTITATGGGSLSVPNLTLQAGNGVGSSASPLKIAAVALSARSTNADIFLAETGTATLFGFGLNAGSGTITLTSGTFALAANNQIAAASTLHLSGATLNVAKFSDTIAALACTSNSTLAFQFTGFSAGQFGNLIVNGTVSLGGATLNLTSPSFVAPPVNSRIVLIRNKSNTPTGMFAGLPEGSIVTVGGNRFRLSYLGGAGHDVTLTFVGSVPLPTGNRGKNGVSRWR